MTFKKWPSIENSYQQKFIDVFLAEFPELAEETFVITEKLHGANLQIHFEPNQPWQIGKRTAFLKDDEKFFGIRDVLSEYALIFERIQAGVNAAHLSLRLFGEFCGPGIQKGVDYGKQKRIFFFGYMIDDELQSWEHFYNFAATHQFKEHLVPILGEVQHLEAALATQAAFDSGLTLNNHVGDNIAEGIVIQPLHRVYVNNGGKTFLLKKKNDRFIERAKAKKPPSPGKPEVQRLHAEFESYVTNNRLQGIFSKYGEIGSPKQIGEYIRLLIADALEEFLKDHGEAFEKLHRGEQGQVTNVGKMIADMLKAYL